MKAGVRLLVVLGALVLTWRCAAISGQKSAPEPPRPGAEFHNLRVFSPNTPHDELIANMRGFSRALGVRCDHCHVSTMVGAKETFDFPSDVKPEKDVARTMLRMTERVNADYIGKISQHRNNVTCDTCHRGHSVPEVTPPPPPAPKPS
jgi:hypothetical protein